MSANILVVDDDPDIRNLLTDVLTDAGYQVDTAPDGQQALDQLGTTRPKLIILDLMMPVMDGWQFYRAAKQQGLLDQTLVLIISATNNIQAATHGLHAAGYVAKPFLIDKLVAEVGRLAPP